MRQTERNPNMLPNNHRASDKSDDCLSIFRLPARLDTNQTATILGFQPHDVAVLSAARLLQPLGKPSPNSTKYFAACEIEELRTNRDWLDKATRTISKHWQTKNGQKPKSGGTDAEPRSSRMPLPSPRTGP